MLTEDFAQMISVRQFLKGSDPLLRWKINRSLLQIPPDDPNMKLLASTVRQCDRVQRLLKEQENDGTVPHHPYAKWYGAHWILAILADMEYPAADDRLQPLLIQDLDWILNKKPARINGRYRVCASQQGYSLYSMLKLGLSTDKAPELAGRLMDWQWPDGGWNCDKAPLADTSSFMETLIPLRALALYNRLYNDIAVAEAAQRAAEVFLSRRLFRRRSDNRIIDEKFTQLHYPCYWRYDILFGLKVMAEVGLIHDRRCEEALDLLVSRQLPGGGYPAEGRYYRVSERCLTSSSRVGWGPRGKSLNPYVTADAWFVLKAAGKYDFVINNGGFL